ATVRVRQQARYADAAAEFLEGLVDPAHASLSSSRATASSSAPCAASRTLVRASVSTNTLGGMLRTSSRICVRKVTRAFGAGTEYLSAIALKRVALLQRSPLAETRSCSRSPGLAGGSPYSLLIFVVSPWQPSSMVASTSIW